MKNLSKIAATLTIGISAIAAVIILIDLATGIASPPSSSTDQNPNLWANIIGTDIGNKLRSALTALAILTAVSTAWFKLDAFRELEQHLSITQTITSWPAGPTAILIVVTTTLTNTSKVVVTPEKGYCRLAQTAPMTEEEVITATTVPEDRPTNPNEEEMAWPILQEKQRTWPNRDLSIEPGESHQETFQFIIDGEVEAVVALSSIFNPSYERKVKQRAETWRSQDFHKIGHR